MALEKPNFWVSNGIKSKINPTHGWVYALQYLVSKKKIFEKLITIEQNDRKCGQKLHTLVSVASHVTFVAMETRSLKIGLAKSFVWQHSQLWRNDNKQIQILLPKMSWFRLRNKCCRAGGARNRNSRPGTRTNRYYPGQKKRPLRLCIKSKHCSYHGILKNQAWLCFGVQRCAKSRPVAPPCQSLDHADIAW